MNSLILEAFIAFAVAAVIGTGSYMAGHKNGVNEQKAQDQAQFDTINAERSKQKTEAAAILDKLQAGIIAQQQDDAKLRKTIDDQALLLDRQNDDLAAALASRSLRFVAPAAAKGRADRSCRAGPASPAASAASAPAATVVQLPEALTRDLRRLVADADRLNVEYGKCYQWVNQEGKVTSALQ